MAAGLEQFRTRVATRRVLLIAALYAIFLTCRESTMLVTDG
jgi:hypothetical protein